MSAATSLIIPCSLDHRLPHSKRKFSHHNWGAHRVVAHKHWRDFAVMAAAKSGGFPENIVWRKEQIVNPSGKMLVGILDDTGSEDVIILCHGFRSSKESGTLINLASALLEAGLSAFRFDFSGNGESEGEFQYGNYWKEVDDLRSVVVHWVQQGRRVKALVGHSKGGNAVLLYASKYRDVDIVVNVSGRFGLQRGVKERLGERFFEAMEKRGYVEVKDKYGNVEYRVTKEGLTDRMNTDMKSAASSIHQDCRVLTVHGSEDEIVSVEEAKEFDSFILNHTLQILDGANHNYSQHQRVLSSIVVNFIKDGLSTSAHDMKKVEVCSKVENPLACRL